MNAGKIEFVSVAEPDVLQQLIKRLTGGVAALSVAAREVVAERLLVQVRRRAAGHRYHVRVNELSALEHALQLFARGHLSLVGALLHPEATAVVLIRLGVTIGDGHHHYHAERGQHVLGRGVQRGAHVLRGRVAYQLIDAMHGVRIKPGDGAVVGHADEQPPAATVGEGR